MTSDARERLRRALDIGHDLSRGRTLELVMAAEALLAEPPAPAHADHDALAELAKFCESHKATRLWAYSKNALDDVLLRIAELRASPHAVPDAGALLRSIGREFADLQAAHQRAANLHGEAWQSRYYQGLADGYGAAANALLARAPQPQPAPSVEEAPAQRLESAFGPVTRDIHKMKDCAHEWSRGVRNSINDPMVSECKLCHVMRVVALANQPEPQPAPEEHFGPFHLNPKPGTGCPEESHMVTECGTAPRREQAQASEADDRRRAKNWRAGADMALNVYRDALMAGRDRHADRQRLDALLDEGMDHWDDGIPLGEPRKELDERDALRKENEELRIMIKRSRDKLEELRRILG